MVVKTTNSQASDQFIVDLNSFLQRNEILNNEDYAIFKESSILIGETEGGHRLKNERADSLLLNQKNLKIRNIDFQKQRN